MTIKTFVRALKKKKPAIIRENGSPRFVVLDWETYRAWEEIKEEVGDAARLVEALADPKNQKRTSLSRVKNMLKLP